MIKVLVVDDSALIRQLLQAMIESAQDMACVGAAHDAYQARDMVNHQAPDVITLDIEMPRMDGLTFLEKLMRARPTPVVMISTLTDKGADATLKALELGAVDFIPKPKIGVREELEQVQAHILDTIRAAAKVHVGRRQGARKTPAQQKPLLAAIQGTEKLIGIGASTGGTEAIKAVLEALPAGMPGLVITQHMPPGFTRTFAARLNTLCALEVTEAVDGERILPGHAYLAPGNWHLRVARSGANYQIRLGDDPPVNRHRPAVDVMFESLAKAAGSNAVGVLLTGMGKDGALGMQQLHAIGCETIAQDAETSLVYGMPRAAVELGAARVELPLQEIPSRLIDTINRLGASNRL